MGEDIVPDMNIVNRARKEDLDRRVLYQVSAMRIVHKPVPGGVLCVHS